MAVRIIDGYLGHAPGTVQQYRSDTEAGLILSNRAVNASGPVTAGNQTTQQNQGRAAIAAGQSSVTISCPQIDVGSVVFACVNQAAADTTLTSIVRVVTAQGSVTLHGNAAATAVTQVMWALVD
jgi:hypothetical protein